MKAITTLGLLAMATVATAQQKPLNVVYILADDLGIGDIGPYGQRAIKTPNLDALAQNGMQFMQHYSGSTVSGPSRCVLMTGKHTGHCDIRGNYMDEQPNGVIYDRTMAGSEVTVAEIFKQRGYATGICGKWGLGRVDNEGSAGAQGFDYFYGFETHIDAHRAYPKYLWENQTKIELGGKQYADELIVQKSLDFIGRSADKPFFLYLATTLPHADIVVPEEEVKPFDDGRFLEKPYDRGGYANQPKPRATFAAMITRIDNTVGRVVALLKEKGIYENTLIIFSSDNGTHKEGGHDPYYFWSNSGFRGTKRDLYEGGVRTPFIASCPELIKPGSVSYHVSAFWDFLPTICEMVDVPVPDGVDGISYLPSLKGQGEQPQHEYLYWEFHEEGGKQAILKENWKLIRLNIHKADKTYYELYNISSDPKELRNVAAEFPGKVEELKTIMAKARTSNATWDF